MKTKPLFLTVCALAAFALLAYWMSGRDGATADPAAARAAGDLLLDPAVIPTVTEIRLTSNSGNDETILRKEGDRWILPEHFGLPADFEKLSRLTTNLVDAEIDRFVTARPESLERLNLGQAAIELRAGDEKAWSLETGDSGQNGGRFIRIDGEEAAYLSRSSLSIDGSKNNWPLKRPLDFEEDDIARVEIELDGETLAFSRDASVAEFAAEELAENERTRAHEVASLVRLLLNARFTEALEPDHADARDALANAIPVTLERFDETRYTLQIGRRPGREAEPKPTEPAGASENSASASIVIDQDGNIVSPDEIAQAEQQAKPQPETDPAAETEAVEPGPVFIFYRSDAPDFVWNDLMENVALKFGDHVFNRLPTDRSDLIETTDPEPEPETETAETSETAETDAPEDETEPTDIPGQ